MGKVYFGTTDGKILGTLGEIKEIELTSEEPEIDEVFKMASESFECRCELKVEGHENLDPGRFLLSGGDKGLYNGMTLKEDGYLSPENGWFEG